MTSDSFMDNRQIPQNLEAEKAALASVLLDNEALSVMTEKLRAESFYSKAHSLIFQAMAALYAEQKPVNNFSVIEELTRSGSLSEAGGASYLADILNAVSTAVNVDYYVGIIREKAVLRDLIGETRKIIEDCYSPDVDINSLLDETEKKILAIGHNTYSSKMVSFKESISRSLETIEYRYKNRSGVTGIPTGFKDFDERTSGMQFSDLVIVAARPSMGKTSFGLNILEHVALYEKLPVAFFSLEMSMEQVVLRMLCSLAEINLLKVRTGHLSENEFIDLSRAAAKLSTAKVFIDDTPGITVMELRAKARRMKIQHDIPLILVDYLQLMQGSGSRRSESRQQDISDISRSLKAVARELNVPVIVISQLNRAVEQRGGDHRPMLSDLRESGAIEQDADVVVMLLRKEYYDQDSMEKGLAEINIAKQRNGPVGSFNMVFKADITKFFDYSPRDDAGIETEMVMN